MLGTVCRAGDLLELFDADSPEWGATAVSRELDITKSQAHEMLVSLEAIGLLRRAGKGRFRLGWKMITLSERLLRSEFTSGASRVVQRLGHHARTSVDLVTFDGVRCVRIAGYGPPNHSHGPAAVTGHVSATGKILLGGMEDERVAALLPKLDLEEELATVRARKLAFEDDDDRRAVAAPVHDAAGRVMAAVGLAVSQDEWTSRGEALTRAVAGTARRLSACARREDALPFVMEEPRLPPVRQRASLAA